MANKKISFKRTIKSAISHLKGDKKTWKRHEKQSKREAKHDSHLITKLKRLV